MIKLSVFEKHSGLRSSIKNSLYYVEFPLEMKKYIEAALEHLYAICEEEVPEKKAAPEMSTGIMSYEEFSKRYYKMFEDYEEELIILNGPDFDMMNMIYHNWRYCYSNTNPLTYCSMLQCDLEKKLQNIKTSNK